MNEFTKEELELLLSSMESWLDSYSEHPIYESKRLIEKIQFMIDEYCEHEAEVVSASTVAIDMTYKCRKCGVFYR